MNRYKIKYSLLTVTGRIKKQKTVVAKNEKTAIKKIHPYTELTNRKIISIKKQNVIKNE